MVQEVSALLEALEMQRSLHSSITSVSHKSDLGQFFTPGAVAMFMASMFPKLTDLQVRLLDPGAGIGALASAFVLSMNQRVKGAHYGIDAYEIDEKVLARLSNNLHELCSVALCDYAVYNQDFIRAAVDHILQFEKPIYTHVILNPPYKKIHSNSEHRKLLRSVDLEIVNLYAAFMSMSLELTLNDGYLVAIIPRSFCNGTYYLPFRKHILANAVIRKIHLFESRSSLFKNDNVLQENVIVMLQKTDQMEQVEVSYSNDQAMESIRSLVVDYPEIVDMNSRELIINVPTEERQDYIKVSTAYKSLGFMVSTGPVVDFRNKEYIVSNSSSDAIPLIYPQNIQAFKVLCPCDPGKNVYITLNPATKKQMYETGYYVVVRRFSSKEEKRRIVAALVNPQDFITDYLAFENHLNVFHNQGKGLDSDVAYGLVAFLNSEGFDSEFRLFSGHTQVNVSDLKRMKYPSLKQLRDMGSKLQETELSYQVFEDILKEVIDCEDKQISQETD